MFLDILILFFSTIFFYRRYFFVWLFQFSYFCVLTYLLLVASGSTADPHKPPFLAQLIISSEPVIFS